MLVHLRAQSHTALRRLTPVSPMAIVCMEGKMVVKHRGFERSLVPGAQYLARAFESVDLHLVRKSSNRMHAGDDLSISDFGRRVPWRRACSPCVL